MFISVEDKRKLDIVKNYKPRELCIIIDFLEGGLFCDSMGQQSAITAEHIMINHQTDTAMSDSITIIGMNTNITLSIFARNAWAYLSRGLEEKSHSYLRRKRGVKNEYDRQFLF